MQLQSRKLLVYYSDTALQPDTQLSSVEQQHPRQYLDWFKSKEILSYQAEEVPFNVLKNACKTEEKTFLKTRAKFYFTQVPSDASIISSHAIYKVRQLDNVSKMCEARITMHGNTDGERVSVRTDYASCPPLGFGVLSIYTLLKFHVGKLM